MHNMLMNIVTKRERNETMTFSYQAEHLNAQYVQIIAHNMNGNVVRVLYRNARPADRIMNDKISGNDDQYTAGKG